MLLWLTLRFSDTTQRLGWANLNWPRTRPAARPQPTRSRAIRVRQPSRHAYDKTAIVTHRTGRPTVSTIIISRQPPPLILHPSFCSGSRQGRADQSHFPQVLHVIPQTEIRQLLLLLLGKWGASSKSLMQDRYVNPLLLLLSSAKKT